ncbi:hypothetical protein [Acinetobacter sp. P1(2025)]|uniref:hypothetical protein n=1 Tax=Acinetobacter sp. P1(2025) TaxID=3446120 RepID=UPI003F52DEA6
MNALLKNNDVAMLTLSQFDDFFKNTVLKQDPFSPAQDELSIESYMAIGSEISPNQINHDNNISDAQDYTHLCTISQLFTFGDVSKNHILEFFLTTNILINDAVEDQVRLRFIHPQGFTFAPDLFDVVLSSKSFYLQSDEHDIDQANTVTRIKELFDFDSPLLKFHLLKNASNVWKEN